MLWYLYFSVSWQISKVTNIKKTLQGNNLLPESPIVAKNKDGSCQELHHLSNISIPKQYCLALQASQKGQHQFDIGEHLFKAPIHQNAQ